jgi:cytochrome c peroxidase
MDFVELADRLKESQEYVKLFEKAYGDRDKYSISTWSISNSLAAYIQSLSRFDSPFDQYVNGKQVDLDEEVKKGYNLFMGKGACGTCHFAPSFSGLVPPFYKDAESEVLGVTTTFDTINPQMDPDPGRRYNGLPAEEADHFLHAFKTVTVRNTEITAPYFHNGAFESLEQVVHFYNKGGGVGLGLEIANQTLPPDELGLTHEEIGFIVSFMESLTDTIGLTGVPPTLPAFEGHPDWNDRRVVY